MLRALARPWPAAPLIAIAPLLCPPNALVTLRALRGRIPVTSRESQRTLGLRRMSSATEGKCGASCSHHEKPHSGLSSTLTGSCRCGSVRFAAHGPSSFNFTCHCQICRDAAPGTVATTSSGFKPQQVEWTGRQHLQLMPEASDNYRKALHYECRICRTHMYEDASSAFGMYMLPARVVPRAREDLSEDLSALPAEFRPNHHIFYRERLQDVSDGLPKWSTVIQGQLEHAALHDASDTRLRVHGYNASTGQYTRHVANLSPPRVPELCDYLFTTQVQPASARQPPR